MVHPPSPDDAEGVTITFGGQHWVIQPLNFKQLKRLLPKMQELQMQIISVEQIDLSMEVVHAALLRNHPDLTVDQLEEMLDLNTLPSVINAIMKLSGLVPAGEAVAGQVK